MTNGTGDHDSGLGLGDLNDPAGLGTGEGASAPERGSPPALDGKTCDGCDALATVIMDGVPLCDACVAELKGPGPAAPASVAERPSEPAVTRPVAAKGAERAAAIRARLAQIGPDPFAERRRLGKVRGDLILLRGRKDAELARQIGEAETALMAEQEKSQWVAEEKRLLEIELAKLEKAAA